MAERVVSGGKSVMDTVDQMVRGKPAAPAKPIWERAGMTEEEYKRGKKQMNDEIRDHQIVRR